MNLENKLTNIAIEIGLNISEPDPYIPPPPGFNLGKGVWEPVFSRSGQWLAVNSASSTDLWNVKERTRVARLKGIMNPNKTFSWDERLLALYDDGRYVIYDLTTFEPRTKFRPKKWGFAIGGFCAFSLDNKWILQCSQEYLLVIDTEKGLVTAKVELEKNVFQQNVFVDPDLDGFLVITRGIQSHPLYDSGSDTIWQVSLEADGQLKRKNLGRRFQELAFSYYGGKVAYLSHWSNGTRMFEQVEVPSLKTIKSIDMGPLKTISISQDIYWQETSQTIIWSTFDTLIWQNGNHITLTGVTCDYHPGLQLAAFSGVKNLVCSIREAPQFQAETEQLKKIEDLKQKQYSRDLRLSFTDLGARVLVTETPEKITLFGQIPSSANPRTNKRHYLSVNLEKNLPRTISDEDLGSAVTDFLASLDEVEAASPEKKKVYFDSFETKLENARAVLVHPCEDCIDLLACTSKPNGIFKYTDWPCVALKPDISQEKLGESIRQMMDYCHIPKSTKKLLNKNT